MPGKRGEPEKLWSSDGYWTSIKKKKSLVLESWTPVQLTKHILSHNHQLIKEIFIEITKGNQGKGFPWVTQLDKNGHFLGLFDVVKLLIWLSILEHLLFPFIAQQNLNPSAFMGFKTPNYCDSVRETSFSLMWKRNRLGKPSWHVSWNWSLKGGLWCSRMHTIGGSRSIINWQDLLYCFPSLSWASARPSTKWKARAGDITSKL